jgi:hypothetical protein
MQLHERHVSSVHHVLLSHSQGQSRSQDGYSDEWVENVRLQLDSRRTLIVAHASVPTIPVESFRC